MSQPFLGQIMLCPYNFPPLGWADCAGQLMSIRQYTALFSLLGTQFGGDGISTFGLPNLQGRLTVGQGTSRSGTQYEMGEEAGDETITLLPSQMAAHSHSVNAVTADGSTNAPANMVLAKPFKGSGRGGDSGAIYNPTTPDTPLVATSISLNGNGQPHNNIQPFLVLRYCIALNGVFPQRS
jgi:microcystin-dependent protein